jgi:hypothetical protein
MVPKQAKDQLKNGKEMKKDGREDNNVCIVQWYDNKEVLSVSNAVGAFPSDTCKRWSKEHQAFINVSRPVLIKAYNDKMGGVDLSDHMIAYYRIAAQTRKWTIRTILHMVDLCLTNSWVQERMERKAVGKNRRELMEFLDFCLSVGESLLAEQSVSSEESDSEEDHPSKRVSLPSEYIREHKAGHLPRMMDLKMQPDAAILNARKVNPGLCVPNVMCTYLSVVALRNFTSN